MNLSPQIQNSINICGDIFIINLVYQVIDSGCFFVLVDENTDVSVLEQLLLCVRYLSGSGSSITFNEDFLKFFEISGLTGNDLISAILNANHYY